VFPVSPFKKTLTDQLIVTLGTDQFLELTWRSNRRCEDYPETKGEQLVMKTGSLGDKEQTQLNPSRT
jgi:hypothetical protein